MRQIIQPEIGAMACRRERNFREELRREGRENTPPCGARGHGVPTKRSESVGAVMRTPDCGRSDFLVAQKERVYQSHKREPLGRTRRDLPDMPDFVLDPAFQFGRPAGVGSAHSSKAKSVLWPVHDHDDDASTDHLGGSRNKLAPGAQIKRGYAWPARVQNPHFAFGQSVTQPREQRSHSVGSTLRTPWACDDAPTQVVSKSGEDFRNATLWPVGHSRPCEVPVPSCTFGMKSQSGYTVRECIRGAYTPEEQLPDKDLGRCVKDGVRNDAVGRVFGKPSTSFRSTSCPNDRRLFCPPSRSRVSDGDGGSVSDAIRPNVYAGRVTAEDFDILRTSEEAIDILTKAGHPVDESFPHVWEEALSREARAEDRASLSAVIDVLADPGFP